MEDFWVVLVVADDAKAFFDETLEALNFDVLLLTILPTI